MNHINATRANPRSAALRAAIDCALETGDSDPELFEALAKLSLSQKEPESISLLLAEQLSKQKGKYKSHQADAPELSGLLFIAAQSDGYLVNEQKMLTRVDAILKSTTSPGNYGRDPAATEEATPFLLAKSPWASTLGLLLNEANPANAPLWPIVCALAPIEHAHIKSAFRTASPCQSKPVFNGLALLACETRDAGLFDTAARMAPSAQEFDEDSANRCASALSRPHAHAGARSELRLEKQTAMEPADAALALLGNSPSPLLAQRLLSQLCIENVSLPDALPAQWKPVQAAMDKLGVTELGIDDIFALVTKANQLRDQAQSARQYSSGDRTAFVVGKWVGEAELDAACCGALKHALLPRKFQLGPDSPPLAYRVADALAGLGPKSQAVAIAFLDKNLQALSADDRDWRRGSSGQTQSIGSAIANLPKNKDSHSSYDLLISKWLCALVDCGFDFEAKATPKSNSLAQRLRTSAQLKQFWPLVESRAIALQTPTTGASKKSPTL